MRSIEVGFFAPISEKTLGYARSKNRLEVTLEGRKPSAMHVIKLIQFDAFCRTLC